MTRPITPPTNFVREEQIEQFRSERHATKFKGCTQIFQLFIKADGKLSCSCMRYWDILADAREVDAGKFYNGPMMQYIRESFAEGYEPFSFCRGCACRLSSYDGSDLKYDWIDLHIEPSNNCNLFCEACLCTFERFSTNMPKRVSLDYNLYEKFLREIHAAGLSVRNLALVGFGEPLFNDRTPDMARLGRELFPKAHIYIDTNANFGKRRAAELADCGLSEIRLGIDGVDQASYGAYRRNGEFERAIQFTRDLVGAIRAAQSSTRVVWKYILFDHNDSDEQLRKAVRMATEIGIPIVFDATVGKIASKRQAAEIEAVTGRPIGCNIDPTSTDGQGLSLGEPEANSPLGRRLSRLERRERSQQPAPKLEQAPSHRPAHPSLRAKLAVVAGYISQALRRRGLSRGG